MVVNEALLVAQLMNIGSDIIKSMQYERYSEEPWNRLKANVNVFLSQWQLIKKHGTELNRMNDYPKYQRLEAKE